MSDDDDGWLDAGLLSLNPSDESIDLSMHSSHFNEYSELDPKPIYEAPRRLA